MAAWPYIVMKTIVAAPRTQVGETSSGAAVWKGVMPLTVSGSCSVVVVTMTKSVLVLSRRYGTFCVK